MVGVFNGTSNFRCSPYSGTQEPNADCEATETNETEFQNGSGSNDGSGKQHTIETMDTVQCNGINMVKNSAAKRHVTFKEETR